MPTEDTLFSSFSEQSMFAWAIPSYSLLFRLSVASSSSSSAAAASSSSSSILSPLSAPSLSVGRCSVTWDGKYLITGGKDCTLLALFDLSTRVRAFWIELDCIELNGFTGLDWIGLGCINDFVLCYVFRHW